MMRKNPFIHLIYLIILCVIACGQSALAAEGSADTLRLTERDYFRKDGVDVLVFSNAPGGTFNDAKTSGIEVIHHGERTLTNGDVRLGNTPEQWDSLGILVDRTVDTDRQAVISKLRYPELDFDYQVRVEASGATLIITVMLDRALPEALVGKAGFNLELLPAAYWDKSFLVDGRGGQFPRSPFSPPGMRMDDEGRTTAAPLASGQQLALAPESPEHRISIRSLSEDQPLMLYDGRTKAQNGWYVVRSLLPAHQSGEVLRWSVDIHGIPHWRRAPVIAYSQVGYHPRQSKTAYLELDLNTTSREDVRLLKIKASGEADVVLERRPEPWGQYLRYRYLTFDFSEVTDPGIYQLQYGDQTTPAFRIDADVYAGAWQATLDYFMPIQMDHMLVREAYRTWHGLSHMDDALQAPANYEHFDLYAHDGNTDSPFSAFAHIPGLNVGGWYDAGDYDIRTQSQYQTVELLVQAHEAFGISRDNVTVRQDIRYVELQRPNGRPDILEQIEHGSLALIAQHRAFGHAIPGIVAGQLYQYPHLGDGATKTDGLVYDRKLDPNDASRQVGDRYRASTTDPRSRQKPVGKEGGFSGQFDDRWAFTSNTSALNYGSAAALAAASRVLRELNPDLASECLDTARNVWVFEAGREPNTYRYGNTTGDRLEVERFKAAAELLLATGDEAYARVAGELMPRLENTFRPELTALQVRIAPTMGEEYKRQLRALALAFLEQAKQAAAENPFAVPIYRGGWAGNARIMQFGITAYWLHQAFPDLVGDQHVFNALHYLFGAHPDSSYSFVSAVGTRSQTLAYGSNRADFSFIPGGVVPGILVLQPDYPENKSDWPFFWGQNEYVITAGARYLFLVQAAGELLQETD